ncbi:MAG TPA: hypothetical protein VNH15_03865 [Elusimicrobiota bacterium]|nr:hypothetical protein [Elusimicrobiota bacterium]
MKKILLCCACALLAACSGKRLPPGDVSYSPKNGGFSAAIPGSWRVLENNGGALASFFGPPNGPAPFSAMIAIYDYPKSRYASPQDYYNRATFDARVVAPLSKRKFGGRDLGFFSVAKAEKNIDSGESTLAREETVLVPSKDGFYALVYLCSDKSFQDNEPVFLNLAASFAEH